VQGHIPYPFPRLTLVAAPPLNGGAASVPSAAPSHMHRCHKHQIRICQSDGFPNLGCPVNSSEQYFTGVLRHLLRKSSRRQRCCVLTEQNKKLELMMHLRAEQRSGGVAKDNDICPSQAVTSIEDHGQRHSSLTDCGLVQELECLACRPVVHRHMNVSY